FHGRDVGKLADHPLDQLVADLLVGDLAPPTRDGDLHLVAGGQELARVVELESVIMLLDLGPHLDLFELHLVLLLLGLPSAPALRDAARKTPGGISGSRNPARRSRLPRTRGVAGVALDP